MTLTFLLGAFFGAAIMAALKVFEQYKGKCPRPHTCIRRHVPDPVEIPEAAIMAEELTQRSIETHKRERTEFPFNYDPMTGKF